MSETVALDEDGTATYITSALETGMVIATFPGDPGRMGSTNFVSVTVDPADTVTTVTADPEQSVNGETVILTATVTAEAPGSGTPNGTVTFTGPSDFHETVDLDAVGVVTLTISDLKPGSHDIVATFNGDGKNAVSSSTLTYVVKFQAPQGLAAKSGSNVVHLSWDFVEDAEQYRIYQRTGDDVFGESIADLNGTKNAFSVTGLSNGTTYYFAVSAGDSGLSDEVSAVPVASTNAFVSNPPSNGINVIVNGKIENTGTSSTSTVNNRIVTTVTVNPDQLDERLANEDHGAFIVIPVQTESDVVVSELTGRMIKNMELKQAILEIQTEEALYTLPASYLNIDDLAGKLGDNIDLKDIRIQIEIATPSPDMIEVVEHSAIAGEFMIVAPPVNFEVKAMLGDTVIDVSHFNAYVERRIAIPDGVDPNKMTTAIVIDPDGTARHVPTKIEVIDGRYYATVNSLTNSTYSVVWHPVEFADVAEHWSSSTVNDMASRMIISGMGDGNFGPNQDITRAEFAMIMVRGLGLKVEDGMIPFSDVFASDWYGGAILTAYEYGLINGFEDRTFRPQDKITREQAMVVIAKAMTITGLNPVSSLITVEQWLRSFTDAEEASN